MDDDNDFTFCQVSAPVEAHNYISDIGGLMKKDEPTSDSTDKLSDGFAPKDEMPSNGVLKKEASFGSLSFTVVDASASKQTSVQASLENGGNAAKVLQEPRTSARKPAPRAKVAFEIGHSPMDWLKLTRTHPDLAGLKGHSNRRLIPMSEVKEHRTEGSKWTVLKGRVYNLSPYLKFHPGGEDILMKAVGKDCTSLFNKYHAWVNAEFLLEKCLVGTLDDSK